MEMLKKVGKFTKLVDDSGELNYTTVFGIAACVKVLGMGTLDIPGMVMLMGALAAHHVQEAQRG